MAEEIKNNDENILERIKREILNFKKKKEALVGELRLEFPKLLIPLMEQSNHIQNISWTQYTPYFNDGDVCEFSVNTDYLEINNESEDSTKMYSKTLTFKIKNEDDIERDAKVCEEFGYRIHRKKKIGDYGYRKNIEYSKYEDDILKNIKKIMSQIPEDFYRDLFGDHARVTISKEGTLTVNEYEHD